MLLFEERLAPGDRVGPYLIHRRIGRGGMAEVFEARREDGTMMAQPVAIKLLRRRVDDAGEDGAGSAEKRFFAERQILAALSHPGIARLLDGGVTAGGTHYVVMEFVRGLTLADYVRGAGLTLEAKLRLFVELCDAVHYAHRHLIVHRDLKPANVMVTEEGRVKLLDFGIAKLLSPESWRGVDTPVTLPEHRLATPEYAAPEQLRGEMVTTSSDVYSLGVIFYRLLCGHMPYDVENKSWLEIQYLVSTREPLPLNTLDGPGVERDLEAIALTALRKEPGERYSSAEHFAEDVRRYLTHQPVRARRGEWIYPARKFVRRHMAVSALAASLAAVLTVSGLALAWQARLLALERDTARSTTQFLFELFDASEFPNAAAATGQQEPTVRAALDEGARRLWKDYADQPWMRAALAEKLGGVYGNLGHVKEALPLVEEAARVHTQVFGPLSPEAATAMLSLANLLRQVEDQQERAESLARQALDIRRARHGSRTPEVAEALGVVGLVAQAQGLAKEAEDAFREALDIRRASLPAADPRLAMALEQLGNTLARRGDYEGAFRLLGEALQVRRKTRGEEPHPRTASMLGRLSAIALARHDNAEALRLASEAVEMARAVLPAGHPDIAAAERHQANALRAAAGAHESARRQRGAPPTGLQAVAAY